MASEKILSFQNVFLEARPPYDTGLDDASLSLRAGELALIIIERGHGRLPLADAAEGLIEPDRGNISILGQDWRRLVPEEAAGFRGRIGRVFETAGWISNLNIDENITLAQRHHTSRPEGEIKEEAQSLARTFGLKELPEVRPALLKRPERKRAEWIRAFMGAPLLIILEEPMGDVYTDALPYLVKGVQDALARGAGVLWITSEIRPLGDAVVTPVSQFRLRGSRLLNSEATVEF